MIFLIWLHSAIVPSGIISTYPVYSRTIIIFALRSSTSDACRIFPDDLLVVTTLISWSTRIWTIVVVLLFFCPCGYSIPSIRWEGFGSSDYIVEIFSHIFTHLRIRVIEFFTSREFLCPLSCTFRYIAVPYERSESEWYTDIVVCDEYLFFLESRRRCIARIHEIWENGEYTEKCEYCVHSHECEEICGNL